MNSRGADDDVGHAAVIGQGPAVTDQGDHVAVPAVDAAGAVTAQPGGVIGPVRGVGLAVPA